MTTNAISKDEIACIPTLQGGSNFPIWKQKMTIFLRHKELLEITLTDPGLSPAGKLKKPLSKAAWILIQKLSEGIYVVMVNDNNGKNSYEIWKQIDNAYAKTTPYDTSRALTRWAIITFTNDLKTYLD